MSTLRQREREKHWATLQATGAGRDLCGWPGTSRHSESPGAATVVLLPLPRPGRAVTQCPGQGWGAGGSGGARTCELIQVLCQVCAGAPLTE